MHRPNTTRRASVRMTTGSVRAHLGVDAVLGGCRVGASQWRTIDGAISVREAKAFEIDEAAKVATHLEGFSKVPV